METNDYCMEQYLICIQALQEEQLHTECPVSVVEPDDPPYTTPEEENSVDAEPSPSDTLDRQ
ncbi:MAG: hypothetical protein D6753_18565 [Planctomycetota bacterium]|nr:MAG: hypothetical protein D6753_18565 [Planctomycetota bacterium]